MVVGIVQALLVKGVSFYINICYVSDPKVQQHSFWHMKNKVLFCSNKHGLKCPNEFTPKTAIE